MRILNKIFFTLLIVVLAIGCKKESGVIITFPDADEYYPLEIGNEYIYQIDSINYSDFDLENPVDTFYFQLKETVTDTFTDLAGRMAFKLERYKRFYNFGESPDALPWTSHHIWWVVKEEGAVHRIEENVEVISVMSPVKNDFQWDGNALNFKQKWDFTYNSVGEASGGYSNTVTVVQRNDIDKIEHEYYEEVFAKDVGLIKKHFVDVESQAIDSPLPVIDRIEKGAIYTQSLVSFTTN